MRPLPPVSPLSHCLALRKPNDRGRFSCPSCKPMAALLTQRWRPSRLVLHRSSSGWPPNPPRSSPICRCVHQCSCTQPASLTCPCADPSAYFSRVSLPCSLPSYVLLYFFTIFYASSLIISVQKGTHTRVLPTGSLSSTIPRPSASSE